MGGWGWGCLGWPTGVAGVLSCSVACVSGRLLLFLLWVCGGMYLGFDVSLPRWVLACPAWSLTSNSQVMSRGAGDIGGMGVGPVEVRHVPYLGLVRAMAWATTWGDECALIVLLRCPSPRQGVQGVIIDYVTGVPPGSGIPDHSWVWRGPAGLQGVLIGTGGVLTPWTYVPAGVCVWLGGAGSIGNAMLPEGGDYRAGLLG